ncbi:uncharacterized protein FA14DRAFT_88767 [Meira miltonrushii]|uniref:Zn(2)-C6 fungal-type domain-containing protein n=1 Tax=Meira miltonrushii TaxID=1280837 RepID=A0A316V5S7_9BASI|nr:uncharacterized protein FA14DRAFT_88767 [Meira miltonrushii]PWN31553.1 hypothetical protein FA14DRAFT_88767 [Meira miltonrushii]
MSPDRKKRQKYAIRSCLACRKRKVKCQLSNVEIPSSLEPLQGEDACQRCKKMDLDCIVWDGERKSKRYTIESASIATEDRRSTTPRQSTSSRNESTIDRDQILSPFYPFKPTFKPTQEGVRYEPTTEQAHNNPDRSGTKTQSMMGKVRLMGILRRPILMMTQILERQDKFRCGIPQSAATSIIGNDIDCSFLSEAAYDVYDLGVIIQHPHLPRLRDLYMLYRSSPNPSRKLLLYTMLLLCRSNSSTNLKHELASIQRTVSQLALQSVLNAPRNIEAAQALELIAVHCPFLLASGEGADQRRLISQEDASTAGSVMIAIAIKIFLSLGFEPKSASDSENVLWTSLCSWELALSFHDHHPIKPRQLHTSRPGDLIESIAFTQQDDEWICVGKIARWIGCKAMYFRSRAVLESGKCELESEALMQESKNEAEMQARQASALDGYQAKMKDEECDRCRGLSRIKSDLQSENVITQKASSYTKLLLALTNLAWLWLDLEAIGMHYILLSKALGNMHSFIIRTKGEDALNVGQSVEASNSLYRIDFRQRIWEQPEWSEHVAIYGKLRQKVTSTCISRSCQLRQHIQDVQLGLDAAALQKEQTQDCRAIIPVPLLSAILMNATKSLLDTQIVLLQAWNHVHEDTDMYVVIIRQAAEVLSDERMDVRIFNSITGEFETGIGQCCADILRIIADTMSDWQNKQRIVLANYREKQKTRAAPRVQQNPHDSEGVHATNSINAGYEAFLPDGSPMLFDPTGQVGQISDDQTQSSTPVIFDQLPTLNTLLEGMLEIPDLNDFIASMNQQQISFSLA